MALHRHRRSYLLIPPANRAMATDTNHPQPSFSLLAIPCIYDMTTSSAQKGFLSSPSGGRPAPKQNFLIRFINTQILAPEHRPGNLSIVWGLGVFTAGIIVARKFGDLITPVF